MPAKLKELTPIFLFGPFAGSAFLLLYVVDQGILISGLGVNKPVPMDLGRAIGVAAGFSSGPCPMLIGGHVGRRSCDCSRLAAVRIVRHLSGKMEVSLHAVAADDSHLRGL